MRLGLEGDCSEIDHAGTNFSPMGTMNANSRSSVVTQPVELRAPNRSMLRAVGFQDADFEKPIVGVANLYSNLTPCNLGLGALAKRAERALHEAGVMPRSSVPSPSQTESPWAPRG
jgi:dihydroxyacid dehydratase/phosphogluconate dehydratase